MKENFFALLRVFAAIDEGHAISQSAVAGK
jgi:hypothetical protein